MNGEPPLIRVAYHDEEDGFQLTGTFQISLFGCVPAVGDILRDTLTEWDQPLRVRRRVFIRMTAEPDIWWLLVDRMADDQELDNLVELDAEMRAGDKELQEELRHEEEMESRERLTRILAKTKKKPRT